MLTPQLPRSIDQIGSRSVSDPVVAGIVDDDVPT
jgi:hypothetical protein